MDNRIVIIDGNSLMNRAYYAMQRPMMTRDGIHTQGIFGFINMLEKIKKEYPSGYIVVTFDRKAPTFRHEQYKEYKAGRKKMPEELAMQMPILKDVLAAMKIQTMEKDGVEADDLMGTIAKKAEAENLYPLIITGDRDLLQLASDKTRILITKKGISQFELFDEKTMVEQYGFTPLEFIDYKGLMGDSSDNIPGLPGVGPKTANRLIREYHSVENILAHQEEFKGKLKETLANQGNLALMSKELATIDVEVALELQWEDFRWEDPDWPQLIELYEKLEFRRFLSKIREQLPLQEEEDPSSSHRERDLQRVVANQRETIPLALEEIDGESPVIFKIFGRGDSGPVGCAMLQGNRYYYFDLEEPARQEVFFSHLKDKAWALVGHRIKEELVLLFQRGIFSMTVAGDTALAEYVLESGNNQEELNLLEEKYLGENLREKDRETQMNLFSFQEDGKDNQMPQEGEVWTLAIEEILARQMEEMEEKKVRHVYEELELPLVTVMAQMEHRGFRVKRETLEEIGRELSAEIQGLTEEIHRLAGETFNINSPTQLGPILFEKLGLTSWKKTKRGYGTGADVLEKIAGEHPIIPLILAYRKKTKLMGTYVEGLMALIGEDQKIHAHFNQTVTATGRISSSNPNLQNIPIREKEGRKIRKAFVPSSPDHILIGADYSQIELRILAHLSGDPALIEAFNRGEDIHRATAAKVWNLDPEKVTPLERSKAKAINFGVIYGMSAFGLSDELAISQKEAKRYIDEYFQKHERVKEYMDEQIAQCKERGYVTTILGRQREVREIHATNFMVRQAGERLAMNSPIQGTAADIIKLAMIQIEKLLQGYRSQLILQVHDELIIDAHREEKEEVKKLLVQAMEQAVALKVRLSVDVVEGENWFSLK